MVQDYIIIIIENFVCHLDLLVDVFLFFPFSTADAAFLLIVKEELIDADLAIASARNFDCFSKSAISTLSRTTATAAASVDETRFEIT